jgi:hypothetical protein
MTTRHRVNEENTTAIDELSEPTGPELLARNMRSAFGTVGPAPVVADDGELTGPQVLARNVKTAFGATDAKKDDPWGPPWGHRVPAKKKRAPAAPAGSSAGASPAAGEEDDVDELPPHIVARQAAQAAQAAVLARPFPQKKIAPPGPKTMRLGPPSSGGDQ